MNPTLIHNAAILPVVPAITIDRGWIRIEGGKIEAIGSGEAELRPGDEVLDARGGLVIPGLVNAHLHSLDVLLRGGIGVGPTFLDWLLDLYYGGIVHYTPEDAGTASLLAGAEALLAGTTSLVDNWGVASGADSGYVLDSARASLDAYRTLGLRVTFARMFATRVPDAWSDHAFRFDPALIAGTLDRCLGEVRQLADEFADGRLIRVAPAPELLDMVGMDGILAADALAADLGVVLPVHLLTSTSDQHGGSARDLAAAGALSSRLLAAHCTEATPDDITELAAWGVAIAHCPTANLAGGVAVPVRRFIDAGMRVGLGTDNPSLAYHLDVLGEARRAALNARLLEPARAALTGQQALYLATKGGADAIGIGNIVGSLEPGKEADLVVLDTSGIGWSPRADIAETLVRRGCAGDVRHVLVSGSPVVSDGRVVALDDAASLAARAQQASDSVLSRAHLSPTHSPSLDG